MKDSDLVKETDQELNDARKSMQKNDMKNSKGSGKQAQENLEEMLNQANSIQQSYQEQTVAEMMNLFQRLVQGVLTLSQDQERMILGFKTGIKLPFRLSLIIDLSQLYYDSNLADNLIDSMLNVGIDIKYNF